MDVIKIKNLINNVLENSDLKFVKITEDVMNTRIQEIMDFVNGIRREWKWKYGWEDETKGYFTNPMVNKFLYSFMIENNVGQIVALHFISVYGERLHSHCTFTGNGYRSLGLGKILLLNTCLQGYEEGFRKIGGYFPNKNNGSIGLFLKMGWQIQSMRNNIEIYMEGDLEEVAENLIKLLTSKMSQNN